MNIFSLFGLIIATGVFFFGLTLASDDMGMFLDYPSMFIVIGGTFAATAVSFQIDRIFVLFKIFFTHFTGSHRLNYSETITEIMKISESYRKGENLESKLSSIKDPFFKEAIEFINDGVIEHDRILKILEDRAENLNYLYTEDANKIKIIGKFPPAFGMMGTTIGMIVLLANLGGPDALKMIGPAMGVCLITTLYGVVIANLVFVPISESLIETTKNTNLKNQIIIEGVRHLLSKSNPVILVEELNSFLIPSKRLDWKQALGQS